MFYGTAVTGIICILVLIVTCCLLRRQRKTTRTLNRQVTTFSNPHANNFVEGFPSPLQLDAFVAKTESPYDMPDRVEVVPGEVDVSYVIVTNGDESESQYTALKENDSESPYTALKGNGTTNSIADNDSREIPSPSYTNASVFEMDPYQELIAVNRSREDNYASLIKPNPKEEKDDEVKK